MRTKLNHRHFQAMLAGVVTLALLLGALLGRTLAQPATPLATSRVLLVGMQLQPAPEFQVVPKNQGTSVPVNLIAPGETNGAAPTFPAGAVVLGELRGPALGRPVTLSTPPGGAFSSPPLPLTGLYTIDDIRLVSNGEVLLLANPSSARIEVIDRVLVSQVTSRPLTAEEIKERGIVIDQSNYQVVNFTIGLGLQNEQVKVELPMIMPSGPGASFGVGVPARPMTGLSPAAPPEMVLPTLRTAFGTPNVSISGFSLNIPEDPERKLPRLATPLPGVVIIPGNIAYLNQFFSVILKVSNVAPGYSNLEVRNLRAEIVLPGGRDTVYGTGDDPLRPARTGNPPADDPALKPIRSAGPDGQPGTADDVDALAPQQSGDAEYLVEGRREGVHVVDLKITGTLYGLPGGPAPVEGRAQGVVEVRNPTFALTFNHPATVSAGEEYDLLVTLTNVLSTPANFASINLLPRSVAGAVLLSAPTQSIETIAAGDSATVAFRLLAQKTGTVTANSLASDGVPGKFELRTAVGELGIPMSPSTLALPPATRNTPKPLNDAALALLNQALALATAPVPPAGLLPIGRSVVMEQATSLAGAGQRIGLFEPVSDAARDLALDFLGNNFTRLAERVPANQVRMMERDYEGFDQLLRQSRRGVAFQDALGTIWGTAVQSSTVLAFQQDFAEAAASRPRHLSVVTGQENGPAPVVLSLTDAAGRLLGQSAPGAAITRTIPYGGFFTLAAAQPLQSQMALVAVPRDGDHSVDLVGAGSGSFDLGLVVPSVGGLRQVAFEDVPMQPGGRARLLFIVGGANTSLSLLLDLDGDGVVDQQIAPTTNQPIADRAPRPISAVQLYTGKKDDGTKYGQIVGVLFSEEVTAASVQDVKDVVVTNFAVDANQVRGVKLQPDQRVVLMALRDGVGPYITRTMTISGVVDIQGVTMQPAVQTLPIRPTIEPGASLAGTVRRADGTPIPFAQIQLSQIEFDANDDRYWEVVSVKSADERGRFTYDYIRFRDYKIDALDAETRAFNSAVGRPQFLDQAINIDVVMVGTGAIAGVVQNSAGQPLANAYVRFKSLDARVAQGADTFFAETDANGAFAVGGIPVGSVAIDAVHSASRSQTKALTRVPAAGAVVTETLTLLPVDSPLAFGNLQGQVFRPDGVTPAANLTVYSSLGGYTVTDAAGFYRIDGASVGEVFLRAIDQEAYEAGDIKTSVTPSQTTTANILLRGGVGAVRGIVREANGAPAVGVTIAGGPQLVTTDANGAFALSGVPIGNVQIMAIDETLGRTVTAGGALNQAGDELVLTIVLPAKGVITGRVRQADGRPAANVKVIAFGAQVNKTFTNAQGEYRFENMNAGDYTVSAFFNDFSDGNLAQAKLVFHNQTQVVNIDFRGRGRAITGIVYDDDGVTPLGARVGLTEWVVKIGTLSPPENPLCLPSMDLGGGQKLELPPCEDVLVGFQQVQRNRIVNSDPSSGVFTFTAPFVGTFMVEAANPFAPQVVSANGEIPSLNASASVTLSLLATGVITGTVYQPDGVTPVGRDVMVTFDGGYLGDVTVVTDENGRYSFPLVNPGAFRIVAEDQVSGLLGSSTGAVQVGQTVNIPVRLLREGSVVVNVVGTDGPVNAARVTLDQSVYPPLRRSGVTNAAGVVTFQGGDFVREGSFSVQAYDSATGTAGSVSGSVPGVGASADGRTVVTVTLSNATGTVTGRFLRGDGVTPIPNAQITFRGAGRELFSQSDAQGRFTFQGVLPGAFSLDAYDPITSRAGRLSGELTLLNRTFNGDIVERALGRISGRVLLTPDNTPIASAPLRLSGPGFSLDTVAGLDGAFTFPSVPAGAFTLFATEPASGRQVSATGVITDEGQNVALTLTFARIERGRVEGTVRLANGAPATLGTVTLNPSGRVTTLDANGRYIFDNVPVGAVEVRVRTPDNSNGADASGRVAFDGDVETLDLQYLGAGAITGVVRNAAQQPVGFATVTVVRQSYQPVGVSRTVQADASGRFTVTNVLVGTYSATARQAVTNLGGAASGVLSENNGTLALTVTLQEAGGVTGRVLREDGVTPAPRMALILRQGGVERFGATAEDGTFTFSDLPLGSYALAISDPLGAGIAQATATVAAQGQVVDLGDLRLDDAPPAVAAISPANGASGLELDTRIIVTFTEPVRASTVTAANLPVTANNAAVTGTWTLNPARTVATFTASQPYRDFTTISVRVRTAVQDDVGRSLASEASAAFATADRTPPALTSRSPLSAAFNVALTTPIRLTLSEAVNAAAVSGPAVRAFLNNQEVTGTITYLQANTVVLFTPAAPWTANSVVRVEIAALPDSAGNALPAQSYSFDTLDLIFPVVQTLTAPNGATVLAGDTARIVADVGTQNDIDYVEFLVDGQSRSIDDTAPYSYDAPIPPNAVGALTVAARAVDRAGNVGVAATLPLTVQNDTRPQIAISQPLSGTAVATGSRVTVTVAAADDRGLAQIFFQASGAASAAGNVLITPTVTTRQADFVVTVPANAAPGSRIELRASATDTRGQISDAATSALVVSDATAPTVVIVAPAANTPVTPGALLPVTVTASDNGAVASVRLIASGAATFDATQPVTPPAATATVAFQTPINANARPSETLVLVAQALDAAGNAATPVTLTLPVRDAIAPAVAVTLTSGAEVLPGGVVTFTVAATDESAVARLGFEAPGGVPALGSRLLNPATASASALFTTAIPASALAGETIIITGVATDTLGNVGRAAPAVVTVVTDTAPTAAIAALNGCELSSAACELAVVKGASFTVTVTGADETGVTTLRLRTSGAVAGVQNVALSPTVAASAVFTVSVPDSVAHNSVLTLTAEAVDTRGQSAAASLGVTVLDRTPPTISINSPVWYDQLTPGVGFTLQTGAVDNSAVARIHLTATGALSVTASQIVSPPLSTAYNSFALTVPVEATAREVVTFTVVAEDIAGNFSAPVVRQHALRDIRPPQVSVTTAVTEVLPGASFTATVAGVDEIGVNWLGLEVTGTLQTSFSRWVTAQSPVSTTFTVPIPANVTPGASIVLIGLARDAASNQGASTPLTVTVGTPQSSVTGAVRRFGSGAPVAGALVELSADSGFYTATTDANGVYRVLDPVVGGVYALATESVSGERGIALGSVAPGQTTATVIDIAISQRPAVTVTLPVSGATLVQGSTVTAVVDASDDNGLDYIELLLNGATIGGRSVLSNRQPPFSFTFVAPFTDAITLTAQATDDDTNVGVSAAVVLNVIPDALTTVRGVVVDASDQPVAGVLVSAAGARSALTAIDGSFVITDVPTIAGDIVVSARGEVNGIVQRGQSTARPPVVGGETNVGQIRVAPNKVWDGDAGDGLWMTPANWNNNTLPGADDDVYIPAGATVRYTTYYYIVRSLRSDGQLTVESGQLYVTEDMVVRNHLTQGSAATINATGDITVTGVFTWSGGTHSGAGRTVAQGGLMLDGGFHRLSGRTLLNGGNGAWTAGDIGMESGARIVNPTGSVLTVEAAARLYHYFSIGAAPLFQNQGELVKRGTGAALFDVRMTNDGALRVAAGTLGIEAPLAHNGSLEVAEGATLSFANGATGTILAAGSSVRGAGNVQLAEWAWIDNPATIEVRGEFVIGGETLLRNGPVLIAEGAIFSTARLFLDSGQLRVQTPITVTDVLTWNASSLTGAGSTYVTNRIELLPNLRELNGGHRLINAGAATWRGTLHGLNGAVWQNLPGASIELIDSANNEPYRYGVQPAILNAGVIRKATPATTAVLRTTITNTGVIEVAAGTLAVEGATTTAGSLQVQSGATLQFVNGAFAHSVTASGVITNDGAILYNGSGVGALTLAGRIRGAGSLQVDGGAVNVTSGAVIENLGAPLRITNGVVTLASGAGATLGGLVQSAGVLQGSDAITVTGAMTWTGGVIQDQGALLAAGPTTLGNGTLVLNARRVTLTSATTWQGGVIQASNGASVNVANGATLAVAGDSFFDHYNSAGAAPSLVIDGALSVDATAVYGPAFEIEGVYINNGASNFVRGQTVIYGATTQRGGIDVQANGVLENRGVFTAEVGSSISGAGVYRQQSGTTTVAGAWNHPGVTQINSGTFAGLGSATLTPAALVMTSGVLTASSDITVTQVFTWNAGTLSGSGRTVVAGQLAMVAGQFGFDTARNLDGRTLVVANQAYWSGATLRGYNGAQMHILPGASLDLQVAGTLEHFNSIGARPTLRNEGLLLRSGTGELFFDWALDNRSEVRVDGGVLNVRRGGESQGVLTANPAGVLRFASAYTLTTSSTVQGAGIFNVATSGAVSVQGVYAIDGVTSINGGALTFEPAATVLSLGSRMVVGGGVMTLRSGEALSVPTYEHGPGAGELVVDDTLTVTGVMTWTEGTLRGAGRLIVQNVGAITGTPNKILNNFRLDNAGTLVWSGGAVFGNAGSVITNLPGATFDIRSAANLNTNPTAWSFVNQGAVIKSSGGVSFIAPAFTNAGLLNVVTGTLQLAGGGVSTGQIAVEAGATVEVRTNAYTMAAGSSVQGAGRMLFATNALVESQYAVTGVTEVSGGTAVTFAPTATLTSLGGTVVVAVGDLALNSGEPVTLPNLTLNSGFISGSDAITVSEVFAWNGGTLRGSGPIFLPGQTSLATNNNKVLRERRLENSGSMVWSGGAFFVANGAQLRNLPGATFDIRTDAQFTYDGTILPQIFNEGALLKSAGALEQTVYGVITNTGAIQVMTGTLFLRNSFVQSAGVTSLEGGNLRSAAALQVQGGVLRGRGLISGDLTNGATVDVEPLGSALQVSGRYTQLPTGNLLLGLQSADAAAGFDRLQIGGQAVLSGTLTITRPTGYTPANGESFAVVTFASRSGQFTAIDGLDLGDGAALTPVYNAANLTLQAPAGQGGNSNLMTLTDGAGMRYGVDCQAQVTAAAPGIGVAAEGETVAPVARLYALTVNGVVFPCVEPAQVRAAAAEQIVYGPLLVGGVQVTRQVYVPATGNFVRTIEALTNSTDAAQSVAVAVQGELAGGAALRVLRAPAADAAYALVDGGDGQPVLAHVFGRSGARLLPEANFADGASDFSYRWHTIMLQPGETLFLMYVTAHLPAGDVANAAAQAQALSTLADAAVVADLSAELLAQIANFAPAPAEAPALQHWLYLPAVQNQVVTGVSGVVDAEPTSVTATPEAMPAPVETTPEATPDVTPGATETAGAPTAEATPTPAATEATATPEATPDGAAAMEPTAEITPTPEVEAIGAPTGEVLSQ